MAQNDVLKRYIDAGIAFTAMTQSRAEALVKDLVKAGEVQAEQAREVAAELVERGRKNSEQLLETVRREVKQQITSLGLVSKADLDKAEARISSLVETAAAPVRNVAKKAPAVRTAAAKKAAPAKSAVAGANASSAAKKATTAAKKTAAKKQA